MRAAEQAEDLGHDWVPVPLGPRLVVEDTVAELLSGAKHLMLSANIEGPDESDDPRAITISGVWGDEERAVLRELCKRLSARFYDAEMGSFVAL